MAGLRCQTVLLTAAMLVLTAAAGAGLTPKPTPDAPPDWMWDTYHDHDEITSYLAWLNASFPALVHVVEVGRSSLGRPLLAARLTGHRSTSLLWKRKPRVKVRRSCCSSPAGSDDCPQAGPGPVLGCTAPTRPGCMQVCRLQPSPQPTCTAVP